MSKSARSVFIFGIYLGVIGLILLLVPNMLITPFGIEPTYEVWIRLSGILLMALAVYYTLAAKHEMVVIMKATAFIRLTIIFFFTAFALFKLTSPNIIIFSAIDFLGGAWTLFMLKNEGHFERNN
ncbi:MAG: hypothetical protein Q8M15_05630 [Bacteroidota bacterium]|nr:hypothetical protein [Bacteroidota bacterium]